MCRPSLAPPSIAFDPDPAPTRAAIPHPSSPPSVHRLPSPDPLSAPQVPLPSQPLASTVLSRPFADHTPPSQSQPSQPRHSSVSYTTSDDRAARKFHDSPSH